MFILGALIGTCATIIVTMPESVAPILPGQDWVVSGLGRITILKSLSRGNSLSGDGLGFEILYQMEDGRAGYCKKMDIWKLGELIKTPKCNLNKSNSLYHDKKEEPTSDYDHYRDRNTGKLSYVDVDYWSEASKLNRIKISKKYD